jgi:hypothetical protein
MLLTPGKQQKTFKLNIGEFSKRSKIQKYDYQRLRVN